jgi:hypothetical protein
MILGFFSITKKEKKMKKGAYIVSIALVFSFLITGVGLSQETPVVKKEKSKVERIKKKKLNISDSKALAYYSHLLQKKDFVFAADFAGTDDGLTFFLDPTINFVSVIGDTATFQFGRNGAIGWNGVGGVTAHGIVNNYKYFLSKKHKVMTVTSDANMLAPISPAHFTLYVFDDGTAQLMLDTPRGELVSMTGRIYSPRNSGIFEGQSPF